MFARRLTYHSSSLVEADIISASTPGTFPTTTDGIDNAGAGYTLAPGSTLYVAGTGKKYRLGDNNLWSETTI